MATDYRQKTKEVLKYVARKVDEDVIKEFKPKRWSLLNTGATGTPDEHPKSDVDIKLNIDAETLSQYEISKIGPYCACLQAEASKRLGGRDVTIWLQQIEDFDNAREFRLYGRNSAKYDLKMKIGASDLPSPITNKLVLTQWAMKDRKYHDVTFLGGSENTLERVRKDPTLSEPVRWEGYEMAARGMTDLVTALSTPDTVKTSKSILRMAHSLCVSIGHPFLHNYEEIVQASHGVLGGEDAYENLVSEAKEKRDASMTGKMDDYDFSDNDFTDTLLKFTTLCRMETKKIAYKEGYFFMPERTVCMDFYVNSAMLAAAKNITKSIPAAKKFYGLLAGEVVDIVIKYDRITTGFEKSSAPSSAEEKSKLPWIKRLEGIGVPPMLDNSQMKELRTWLSGIKVDDPALQGKILLASGDKAGAKASLEFGLSSIDDSFLSYTVPTGQHLADLYMCIADSENDAEAAKYYKMSLEEDALNPYCWHRLSKLRGKSKYEKISEELGQAMQKGNPWQTYNMLYLDPDKMDDEAAEIWEKSHIKRVERFEKYVELLETDVAKYACGAGHDDLPEKYRAFSDGMKACRDEILKHRAHAGRALVNFLKTDYNPLFGIFIDYFENNYDNPTKKFFEKADMWRRKTAMHVRSGDAEDGEEDG